MARRTASEGPTRLPRAERQAQLLDAAATAFALGGFAATSMEDVAAQAGVTKLIVYRHFSSKEELYGAVVMGVVIRLSEAYARELARPGGQRMGFATRAMLTVAREQPDAFRLLTRHAVREPQFAGITRGYIDGAAAFTDSLIDDLIPDPVVKAWAVPMMVDYTIQGVNVWLDVGDADRDDEFIELATQGLHGMFRAWGDPKLVEDRIEHRT
jgi:AcrR family transcriptional regulator